MSMDLMAKAMKVKVGNPLRKLVLLKLADNADDMGECWPSIPYIASQCEMSVRSVQNHIQALSDSGLLWIEFRKSEKGKNKSNVYHLTLNGKPSVGSETSGENNGESPAPGGESPAPGGESPAPGGESPAPSSGANAAPRTSHSFEPVKEPVKEPKDARKQKTVFTLPDGLNLDAWDLWLKYRSENKLKPYKQTALGVGVVAKDLIELSGGDMSMQMAIVQQSINKQWQGLFELKYNNQISGQSKIYQAQQAAKQAISSGRVSYDPNIPFDCQ